MKTHAATVGLALALAGALAAQQPPAQPQAPGAPGGQGGMMARRSTGRPGGMLPFMGRGMGMGMGVYAPDRLVNRRDLLGLAPDQVARLEALAQDAKQARDKAQADAKPHWDQLAELWKQASPDVAQVKLHAQAAMQAMEAAHLAQLVAAAQAKAVLTPEQRGRVAGWADAIRVRMHRGAGMNGVVRPRMPGGRMRMMQRPAPQQGPGRS